MARFRHVIGLVGLVSTNSKMHAGLVLIMPFMRIASIFFALFEPGSITR